jgi:hypothetical protein
MLMFWFIIWEAFSNTRFIHSRNIMPSYLEWKNSASPENHTFNQSIIILI